MTLAMGISAALRSKVAIVWLFLIGVFFFFISAPLPGRVDDYRDAAVHSAVWRPYNPPSSDWRPTELSAIKSQNAYATFLAGNNLTEEEDVYFLGARLLAYQLIHDPKTKSQKSIPLVVVCTKTVSEAKKKRLRKDGAVVVVVEDLVADWIADRDPINPRFHDVMTKLRMWEMTQFERICLMDGDTVLMDNIDGVFDDPAVQTQHTLDKQDAIRDDEAALPHSYAIASTAETRIDHQFPPSEDRDEYQFGPNYLNSGFIVFQPSDEMFGYYVSLLDKSDGRWGEGLPEQGLLNWAHRRPEGNMPWQTLDRMWNIHFPTVQDMEAGVKSLHEKFWNPEHKDLKPYLEKYKWKMLNFFALRDRKSGSHRD